MNTVIDKLFITPMSWLLAVPIVLFDRMLTPDLPELHRSAALLHEALRTDPSDRCSGSSAQQSLPTYARIGDQGSVTDV